MDDQKPQIQEELEKLGWTFNPLAANQILRYQWTKRAAPRGGRLLGQDCPEWVQDVATALVNIQMKKGL